MQSLVKLKAGTYSASYRRSAIKRLFGAILLSAFAWQLNCSDTVFAASESNVELSPLVAKSILLSAVDPNQEIHFILSLPSIDRQGAEALAEHVSTPSDPLFHKFITPEAFAARFGANQQDYNALKAWAATNGLKIVHQSLNRTILTLSGAADQLQKLFQTQLNNYRSPDGREFYSAAISPTIPDEIAAKVDGVIGLTSSGQYAPLCRVYKTFGENVASDSKIRTDTAGGTGPNGSYSAKDLQTAYQIPSFGKLAPQAVAVFEQGGFHLSDVQNYLKTMKLREPPINFVGVDGYDGHVNNSNVELEAVLDIDMVITGNPDVKEVLVYEEGRGTFSVALIDSLDEMALDNKAGTVSISYGWDEWMVSDRAKQAEDFALVQLSALGINVLASSGDDGAYGRSGAWSYPATLNVEDPGSQPCITSVGGTSLYTYVDESYIGETVWNDLGLGYGASGGGVSNYWPIPDWQPASLVTTNGGSSTYRNVPDIAAVADPITGVAVYSKMNGGWIQIGGTSVSSPLWAGYLSNLSSAYTFFGTPTEEGRLGTLGPMLYTMAAAGLGLYSVLDGTNGQVELFGTPGYNAGPYYNNCTGCGSLSGAGFASAYFTTLSWGGGETPPAQFTVSSPTATKTTAQLQWTASTGAVGYGIFVHTFPLSGPEIGYAYVTPETQFEIKGLTPNTTYYGEVMAANPSGISQTGISFTTLK
jgi:subtilase family serine protease